MEKMIDYSWPGNVRELKHVVERAHILCDKEVIDESFILFGSQNGECLAGRVDPVNESDDRGLRVRMDAYEKRIIIQTLKQSASIRAAARRLGISHPTLLSKMKKHDLQSVRKITNGRNIKIFHIN
jgi:transcriptional regulator of aroF, aroG, tyrA and aromatic amino acid transport